ncbi:MAG: beta-propeller domain-containing protein [Minisyncoccia bacterium]
MEIKIKTYLGIFIILILSLVVLSYLYFENKQLNQKIKFINPFLLMKKSKKGLSFNGEIRNFSSLDDFKNYIQKSQKNYSQNIAIFNNILAPHVAIKSNEQFKNSEKPKIERFSLTNIQEEDIDEPDIVKTNGKEIFFYQENLIYPSIYNKLQSPAKIKVIESFPPENLKVVSQLENEGELLLVDDILVVLNEDKIIGYNVSDSYNIKKSWEKEIEKNNSILAARLFNNKIYLVLKSKINIFLPCPVKIFSNDLRGVIECNQIFYPSVIIPTDVIFTVIKIDPKSGEIEKTNSFIGSSENSILYMSKNALFLTFTFKEDIFSFIFGFLNQKASDFFPNEFLEKISKVSNYDISEYSKLYELEILLNNYLNSLEEKEKIKIINEINNRFLDYYKEHKKEIIKTVILKLNLENLEILAKGMVPGKSLNQFSFSEYNNFLRLATTLGDFNNFFYLPPPFPLPFSFELENNLYILDNNLEVTGKIENFYNNEKIYAVRFIGNRGYVVTFKEIDPFFIFDLSDPKNPKLEGQLKIPGFSSYLHQLSENKILGIGKEGPYLKISLFDVENPKDPKELSKYILKEWFSEVLNNHHAFLSDPKYEILFLPVNNLGYIFSYANNKLTLKKIEKIENPKRAIFINDFLYILSQKKIIVLNEKTFEKIKEIILE